MISVNIRVDIRGRFSKTSERALTERLPMLRLDGVALGQHIRRRFPRIPDEKFPKRTGGDFLFSGGRRLGSCQ